MRNKRILLIDKHAAFRQALAFLLRQKMGLEVVAQAGSLTEGREHSMSEGFDVAVVDPALPDGDGMDLLRELRVAEPCVSILVLTINLDRKGHARAQEAGAENVLDKEVTLATIIGAIRSLGNNSRNKHRGWCAHGGGVAPFWETVSRQDKDPNQWQERMESISNRTLSAIEWGDGSG